MWYAFDLQPASEDGIIRSAALRALRVQVCDWVSSNKTRSAKVALISNVYGEGAFEWDSTHDSVSTVAHLRVKFRSQRDATLFKLFFSDHIVTIAPKSKFAFDPIILPIIRRALPSILAADICGVQPMTGPVAAIHSMRVRYQQTSAQQEVAEKALNKKKAVMQQMLANMFKGL